MTMATRPTMVAVLFTLLTRATVGFLLPTTATRVYTRRTAPLGLFGGAPPPENEPPPLTGGGKTMEVPGLGKVTEEEMRMAMAFRQKIAERMAAIAVDSSALGGKVKVFYDGQGQPTKVEIADDALAKGTFFFASR